MSTVDSVLVGEGAARGAGGGAQYRRGRKVHVIAPLLAPTDL